MTPLRKPRFNPPPGWPKPPATWQPPAGWTPDPTWPAPPPGWQLWVADDEDPDEALARAPRHAAPESTTTSSPRPSPIQPDGGRLAYLEAENAALRAQLASTQTGEVELSDARVLQEVGIYRYHHPLETAAAYQDRLQELESRIADSVKAGHAIVKSDVFTFNNLSTSREN